MKNTTIQRYKIRILNIYPNLIILYNNTYNITQGPNTTNLTMITGNIEFIG